MNALEARVLACEQRLAAVEAAIRERAANVAAAVRCAECQCWVPDGERLHCGHVICDPCRIEGRAASHECGDKATVKALSMWGDGEFVCAQCGAPYELGAAHECGEMA